MSNEMRATRFASTTDMGLAGTKAPAGLDHLLYAEDIEGSKAHAAMLADREILTRTDASAIMQGLEDIRIEIESGTFQFAGETKDIHINIEHRLTQMIGEAAQRMHMARSHNDQIATDLRLWVKKQTARIDQQLVLYQQALAEKALTHAATVMPGSVHGQPAQPVTFGHHLLAYVEMAARDRGRFKNAQERMNECPLGASMLAGTSLPIDRHQTAQLLGFKRPMQNSIDAVSDQDFIIEALSAAAICASHLLKLAEEFSLWANPQFNFVIFNSSLTTSAPQKRNSDIAELVRIKTGRIYGALIQLLSSIRNLREDKEPLFDTLATLSLSIELMTKLVLEIEPNVKTLRKAAETGFINASDLADSLVHLYRIPSRHAKTIADRLGKRAEERGIALSKFTLEELQAEHKAISREIYSVLKPASFVKSCISEGGTAPKNVRAQARRWLKNLRDAS